MISNIVYIEPGNKGLIRSIVVGTAIVVLFLFGI